MTARWLCLVVVLTPGLLQAQQDSLAPYRGELRLGVQVGSHSGDFVSTQAPAKTSASLLGLEFLARIDGIGVLLRSQSANPSVNGGEELALQGQEARLLIGTRRLSIELGVLRRTLLGGTDETKDIFPRVGLRTQWEIGGSGFDVALNAGAHFQPPDDGTSVVYRGHDAEALLLYRFGPKYPAFAAVGWRLQTVDDGAADSGATLSQSGPVLSVGFRLGR